RGVLLDVAAVRGEVGQRYQVCKLFDDRALVRLAIGPHRIAECGRPGGHPRHGEDDEHGRAARPAQSADHGASSTLAAAAERRPAISAAAATARRNKAIAPDARSALAG